MNSGSQPGPNESGKKPAGRKDNSEPSAAETTDPGLRPISPLEANSAAAPSWPPAPWDRTKENSGNSSVTTERGPGGTRFTVGAAPTGSPPPKAPLKDQAPPTKPVPPASSGTGKSGSPTTGKKSARTPRKAHLVLRRVEPWSMMKFSFVLSLVCFVVLFVAVAVLYGILSAAGVFDAIVNMVNQVLVDGNAGGGINAAEWFDAVRVLGYTALLGALNVILITALSTLGAVIYNVASDLVGGVEVTFSEAE
ncbi:DUF3566 domain-containing protein [Rhizohabitans arisaemae]|uniref:DUF3566 domain-containing protein n=1 Tax=Rhizohabitans arisaemae TaxID=2720610 RepID=UPI0024B26910|nr:DUF3566 domain-containing protein [Rhizohabitans arisaemae]